VVYSLRIDSHTHRARLACFFMSKTNMKIRVRAFEKFVGEWKEEKDS
jgi:hypothetical protein